MEIQSVRIEMTVGEWVAVAFKVGLAVAIVAAMTTAAVGMVAAALAASIAH